MGSGPYTSRYLERDLTARPKEWDTPRLYEHLLAHLRRAQRQIRAQETDGTNESLAQASAVIADLITSVGQDEGGELTRRLASVYAYFGAEIIAVRHTPDQEQLARMIDVVASLHESWVIAARTQWPAERATPLADAPRDGHARA